MEKIKLTQTVQKGGCAAKIAAVELRKILAGVKFPPHGPELLIDSGTFDDAAIYKISDDTALVQTVDFFTPIVDDPRSFGRVAAANAISDVYAMGGKPVTAMAVLAFPLGTISHETVIEVLQGACDVLEGAGTSLAGGHSIDDDSLKFGLSVTGLVNPKRIWSNAGALEGDALILTKALGTGCATAALKRGAVNESEIKDVIDSMSLLNNVPVLLPDSLKESVHACTDITGFGLAGHSLQMAKASSKNFDFDYSKIPVFENTKKFLDEGFLTKAHRTNREYTESLSSLGTLEDWQKLSLFDPQTSGGLLMAVSSQAAPEILKVLRNKFPRSEIIGRVSKRTGDGFLNFKSSSF